LVEQLGVVAAVGRVGQLVGLLERVRDDRALVLLAVPRALDPQAPRQLVEGLDRVGGAGGGRLVRHPPQSSAATGPPERSASAASASRRWPSWPTSSARSCSR